MAIMAKPSYVCSEEAPCLPYDNLVHLLEVAAEEIGEKPAHIFRLIIIIIIIILLLLFLIVEVVALAVVVLKSISFAG